MLDVLKIALPIAISIVTAYLTASYTIRRERGFGKARLLDICRRYVMNFWSAFDRDNSKLRSDATSYKQYAAELMRINQDLDALFGNAYFEKLILEYPGVSRLTILLRREYVELTSVSSETLTNLNKDCIRAIFDLHALLLRDLRLDTKRSGIDKDIRGMDEQLTESGRFFTCKSAKEEVDSHLKKPRRHDTVLASNHLK